MFFIAEMVQALILNTYGIFISVQLFTLKNVGINLKVSQGF